jgi:hypothetical protein
MAIFDSSGLGDAANDVGIPPSLRTDTDANGLAKHTDGRLPRAPCRGSGKHVGANPSLQEGGYSPMTALM